MRTRSMRWERGVGDENEDQKMRTRSRWERGAEDENEEQKMRTRSRRWERGAGDENEEQEIRTRSRRWERGAGDENEVLFFILDITDTRVYNWTCIPLQSTTAWRNLANPRPKVSIATSTTTRVQHPESLAPACTTGSLLGPAETHPSNLNMTEAWCQGVDSGTL